MGGVWGGYSSAPPSPISYPHPLSFHTLPHSFAARKKLSCLFSANSTLFTQNTRGWGTLSKDPHSKSERFVPCFRFHLHFQSEVPRFSGSKIPIWSEPEIPSGSALSTTPPAISPPPRGANWRRLARSLTIPAFQSMWTCRFTNQGAGDRTPYHGRGRPLSSAPRSGALPVNPSLMFGSRTPASMAFEEGARVASIGWTNVV